MRVKLEQPRGRQMEAQTQELNHLRALVDDLAVLSARHERRLRRSERLLRGSLAALVLSLSALAFQAVITLSAPASAEPEKPSAVEPGPHEAGATQKAAGQRAKGAKGDTRTAFDGRMEALREKLAGMEATALEPGHAVSVILHDIKAMLEVMPRMGEDMNRIAATMDQMNVKMNGVPVMAREMQQMNFKMGVMSYGVDSTMGRMGRMMPW